MTKLFFSPSSHSFNEGIACATKSVVAATIFNHLFFWLKINKSKGVNQHEGHTWMYETRKTIATHMPYLSEQQVRDGIDILVKHGYLIKGNFSNNKFDRTNWYAIANEEWLMVQNNFTIGSTDPMQRFSEPNPNVVQTQCYKDKDSKKKIVKEDRGEEACFLPPPKKSKNIPKELIFYGRHVRLKEGEYEELCKELTKPLVDHYIEQMNNYVPNRKQGAYRDYAAAIRQWHRRDQTEGKLPKANNFQSQEDELERITSNRHWFRNFITQIKPPNQFEVTGSYSDYVQFSNQERNNSSAKFYFKDADFKEKIKQESAKRLYVKSN